MNVKNIIMKNFFLVLITLLASTSLMAQGWERIYWGGGYGMGNISPQAEAYKAFPQADGTFTFAGRLTGSLSGHKLINTDENGYISTVLDVPQFGGHLIQTSDGNYVKGAQGSGTTLTKMDPSGNTIWNYNYPYPFSEGQEFLYDLIQASDDDYVYAGIRSHSIALNEYEYLAYIAKVNEAGDEIWKTVTSFDTILNYTITETADNGFLMAGSSQYINTNFPLAGVLLKFDQDGQEQWIRSMDTPLQVKDIVATADGGVVMVGRDSATTDFKLIKVDSNGDDVWVTTFLNSDYGIFNAPVIVNTDDEGIAFIANGGGNIHLFKTDAGGSLLWHQEYGGAYHDSANDLKQTPDGGYIICGTGNQQLEDEAFYIIKTDALGVSLSGLIEGFVKYDLDENCIADSAEMALEDWIVSAGSPGGTFYAAVDENGYYSIEADTGNFDVTIELPNAYWSACDSLETVYLPTFFDTAQVDFEVQSIEQCPLMEVETYTWAYLPCEESTMTVLCKNQGTWIAEDVYVEITFDDSLEILDASVPYTLVSGNTYSFVVGDVDFLQEEIFTVQLMVACDEELLGQTLCSTALIFPDSSCLPIDPMWSGASIEASAWCDDGEVSLQLKNVGTATMPQALQYIVIQDDVIMSIDNYGPLEVNDSFVLTEAADGVFYRIESPQVPNHPGESMPSAFVEACGEGVNGEISLGFVNQFVLDDLDPFIDVYCREVVGAYDPNIKVGYPIGYDASHFIEQNTDIDYVIHFQNVGTASASLVVVKDTISDHLDLATIRPGVSSHDYDFKIQGDGTVLFTFENIMLPDSATDLAGSQGFVKFKISQKEDLAIGTEITNQAAIFFDYNSPVITNKTLHTIGEEFITVDVGEIFRADVSIKVYPNPFEEMTTFEVEIDNPKNLNLRLYDAMGRTVRSEQFSDSKYQLYRKGLSSGIYFYSISDEDGILNSGKVIVE